MYAVHQRSRFVTDPRQDHGDAIKYLLGYLKGTSDKGVNLQPDKNKSFEVYADADFAGNWNK